MPDEMMGAPPQSSSEFPEGAAPSSSASAAPQERSGEIEQSKASVQIALQLLDRALPILGSTSEDGQAVHKAIGILGKRFSGQRSENLGPAELMHMAQSMPEQYKQAMTAQMGGGTPGGSGGTPPAGI